MTLQMHFDRLYGAPKYRNKASPLMMQAIDFSINNIKRFSGEDRFPNVQKTCNCRKTIRGPRHRRRSWRLYSPRQSL